MAKRKLIKTRDVVIWILIILSGISWYWANTQRVRHGYFNDGIWIFLDTVIYVIFFGLVSGYVIAKIIGRK